MPVATQTRAEFLKSAERSAVSISATLRTRWTDAAGDTAQSSRLVFGTDAQAEADRQLALMAPTFAYDSVAIEGVYFDLEGATVRIDYTMPAGTTYFGGSASVDMLVVRARPSLSDANTIIEGLIAL